LAKLLEGRPVSERIKQEIRQQIQDLGLKPVLASIQAGENAAAEAYIKSQKKTAESLGIEYRLHRLAQEVAEGDIVGLIQNLNSDKAVNGILIQLPLPVQADYKKMAQYIAPEKDVEGMHPVNMGNLVFGQNRILPCTPLAVMELLASCLTELYGKEAVIVGHSEIVGKPLSILLLNKFATVTVCHIGTSQAGRLEEHVRKAEVLIVAVGKPGLIKGEWIKEGAVVIDVGINRVGEKIVGDVEFEEAAKRASFITPVPGGVGPLTATMLMRNLIEGVRLQQKPAVS